MSDRRNYWRRAPQVLLAGVVLLVASAAAYKYGVNKGYRLGAAHERGLFKDAPEMTLPPGAPVVRIEKPSAALPESPAPAQADVPAGREVWCFSPDECVRLVWPAEIVEKSDAWPHMHFRFRQGVNRMAQPGLGLCEFVFAVKAPCHVIIYAHCRYSDECGNSVFCQVDGGRMAPLGKVEIYGQWLWDSSHGRFSVAEGLHRLTISARTDGMEFDRVVVAARPMSDDELSQLACTPPPEFDSLPVAGPTLPPMDGVTACAMADHSLVFGTGHRNTISVFLRLNQHSAVSGEIQLRRPQLQETPFERKAFELSPQQRTQLLSFDVSLGNGPTILQPEEIDVFAQGRCVHSQQLNFIKPLSWAFLGPFDDPEERGLYLPLEPDKRISELPDRPEFSGAKWTVIEDGSCYDDFGVVDFNKVYHRPNPHWSESAERTPCVVYAVTCVSALPNHHLMMAFAGDDTLRGWVNGNPLLQQNANTPLETTRMVLGVGVDFGRNFFVFKVPQTTLYWQLLFEPDSSCPYAQPFSAFPCPIASWH